MKFWEYSFHNAYLVRRSELLIRYQFFSDSWLKKKKWLAFESALLFCSACLLLLENLFHSLYTLMTLGRD